MTRFKCSKINFFFLFFLLYSYSLCSGQGVREKAASFKNFEEAKTHLEKVADANQFSGTIWVRGKKEIHIEEAYGMAHKEKGIANNTDTKINIGSINKVFTSVGVMQLVDKGKIKLDDKIVSYIPELKMPMAENITILHLLQMTSGFGSYFTSSYFQEHRRTLRNLDDYLPILTGLTLNSEPGTQFQYSNAGYEILGFLIQRVTGQNYYDYVKENIYRKCKMVNTDAFERDKAIKNLAQGYTNLNPGHPIGQASEGSFAQNVNERHAVKGTAAGGGYSTLSDLYNFLLALNENKLISEKATDMVINRFRMDIKKRKPVFTFRGGSYGINAVISYNTNKSIAVIVLSNYDPPSASSIANRLIETVKQ